MLAHSGKNLATISLSNEGVLTLSSAQSIANGLFHEEPSSVAGRSISSIDLVSWSGSFGTIEPLVKWLALAAFLKSSVWGRPSRLRSAPTPTAPAVELRMSDVGEDVKTVVDRVDEFGVTFHRRKSVDEGLAKAEGCGKLFGAAKCVCAAAIGPKAEDWKGASPISEVAGIAVVELGMKCGCI